MSENISPDQNSTPTTPTPDNSSKPKKRSFKWPRRLFFSFVGLGALAVLIFLIVLAFDLPSTSEIENPNSDQSTQLISSDGQILHKYYSRENRMNLQLNQISPYVVDALIATEDVRFNDHSGIDPRSFFSILKDIILGDEVRGGSTITMQLSRNLYDEVGNENKYVRKVKEYLVSAYIERRFTKREIMEAYLNTVNIYGTSYGIETTANRLFDKTAQDLTVEEAALVVGMLKGQGVYNPFRYPERTLNRRNTIIDQMVKYDFLDSTQVSIDSIKSIPLEASLATQEQAHVKGLAPYYREYVREWLKQWCIEQEKETGESYNIYTDGLRVYTTIDARMQAHAENAMYGHLRSLQADFDRVENYGRILMNRDPSILIDLKRKSDRYRNAKRAGKSESEIEAEFREPVAMRVFSWDGDIDTVMTPTDSLRYYARFLESGMVSIDPRTGYIKAWVGGIDFNYFKYDHVRQGERQVGSTFKPFVYGTAVEAGYTPCTIELNQPVTFENEGGGRWTPKNADGDIGGKMTLRHGLANSVNLITARLMKAVGPQAVAEFAYKLGIESELDEVPSLCLGTTDLTVYELTHAYTTFASMGVNRTPVFITRIEDKNGKVLARFVPEEKRVMNEEDAFMMVELLKGVVNFGTGQRLRYRYKFRNEIGGKTGTTQNQSDGWFMGITPNLVTGVWVGHADRRMHFRSIKYGQGANMALPIWAEYYQRLYSDPIINMPQLSFDKPEGVNIDLSCRTEETEEQTETRPPASADDFDNF